MEEQCGCSQVEGGSVLICPMHYSKMKENSYLNYGPVTDKETNKELSEAYGVPVVVDFSFVGGGAAAPLPHARDHPCLLDGGEHDWYDATRFLKKCYKCGMSYEKPQPSGVFYL